jgi:hypothetical protein
MQTTFNIISVVWCRSFIGGANQEYPGKTTDQAQITNKYNFVLVFTVSEM